MRQLLDNSWQGALLVLALAASGTHAQNLGRDNLIAVPMLLPQRSAVTAMGDYVRAQSLYVWSQGTFLEKAANARLTRARALDKELDNSVKWVETYFQRKLLNREYREKLRPPRAVRLEASREHYETRIRQQPNSFKRGDPTNALNWLLNKLSTRLAAHHVTTIPDPLMGFDTALSPHDVSHLYFNDGSAKSPRRRFRNQAKNVLAVEWPTVFQDTAFDVMRSRYDRLSAELLKAVGEGKVRYPQFAALQETLDLMTYTLQTKYPQRLRRHDPRIMKLYLSGKRFLQNRVSTVFNALINDPQDMLLKELEFDGLTIGDLLRHMNAQGLFFASPAPAGRNTYYKLFDYLHAAYVASPE